MKMLHQHNPLGYSVYLSSFDRVHRFLENKDTKDIEIFTSLHISEEFGEDYCRKAEDMCRWLSAKGYHILADISKKTVNSFGESDMVKFAKRLGISSLRIDYGFTDDEIIEISKGIPIVLNASTINEALAKKIVKSGGKASAMHNFYPRPETGLSDKFFAESSKMLQSNGIPVYAFIPGDKEKRGPVFEGLPTLEKHRYWRPFNAYADFVRNFNVDSIFVGDIEISENEQKLIERFAKEDILPIPAIVEEKYVFLYEKAFTSRPDSPEGAVRLSESREYSCFGDRVEPSEKAERLRGSITVDNILYGRYSGELQIIRNNYPADERVNVIGKADEKYLPLLDCVPNGSQIRLVPANM